MGIDERPPVDLEAGEVGQGSKTQEASLRVNNDVTDRTEISSQSELR